MSRLRPQSTNALHSGFCEATLDWHHTQRESALRSYSAKHGVAHLLGADRKDDAEQRMLHLHFMAAFAGAWPTVVEPLAAWRIVGLESARDGFARLAAELPAVAEADEADAKAAHATSAMLKEMGLYAPGLSFAEWACGVSERRLGAEHPDTLNTFNNLAGLYHSQDRYDEAEPLYLRTLEVRERTLGEEHPSTLISVNNLALLYASQKRHVEAEALYIRDLKASERTLGSDHPSTLISVNNLALLYKSQGQYEEAEPLYLRNLEASERRLGSDHPSTLISVNNLARLYAIQGRYDEAEPLYLRTLKARERMFGEEHPSTLVTINHLAILCASQGRYDEAQLLFKRDL